MELSEHITQACTIGVGLSTTANRFEVLIDFDGFVVTMSADRARLIVDQLNLCIDHVDEINPEND